MREQGGYIKLLDAKNIAADKCTDRQAGILVREVFKFRETIGHEDWPCIISGGKHIDRHGALKTSRR